MRSEKTWPRSSSLKEAQQNAGRG
uniref:Uncharacterized protein n=1 Tax=Anguilla anguilla TaxID=7936 RepID=A0A0E9T214_ANGAN